MGLKKTRYNIEQVDSLIVEIGRQNELLERLGQAMIDWHGSISRTTFIDCFEGSEDLIPESLQYDAELEGPGKWVRRDR